MYIIEIVKDCRQYLREKRKLMEIPHLLNGTEEKP